MKSFFGSHFLEKGSKSGNSGTIGFFVVWNFSLHLLKPGHYFWISRPIKMLCGQASPKILNYLKPLVFENYTQLGTSKGNNFHSQIDFFLLCFRTIFAISKLTKQSQQNKCLQLSYGRFQQHNQLV